MKKIRRNAVILTVALFVCAAVYLNWSYNRQVEDAADTQGDTGSDVTTLEDKGDAQTTPGTQSLASTDPIEDDAGLYYSVNGPAADGEETDTPTRTETGEYDEYFAQVRLERTQARDEAAATLSAVASAEGASQETVDKALASMTTLAERAVKEAELENLIRAKGFIDCVVYLSDEGAKVTVACDGGLTEASVAKITDVITTETDVTADGLTVIEIK